MAWTADRRRAYVQDRHANGVCRTCSMPSGEFWQCDFCRTEQAPQQAVWDRHRDRAHRRRYQAALNRKIRAGWRAEGFCTRCGKHPATTGSTRCDDCRGYDAHRNNTIASSLTQAHPST